MEQLLRDAYLDPDSPSCFSSPQAIKRQVPQATRKEIANFLKTVPSYTLHRRIVNKFKRKPTTSPGKFFSVQCDLIDYTAYANENDGYRWILVIIDIATRMIYTYPLKSKGGKDVAPAFEKFFTKEFEPILVYSDSGLEFKNSLVQNEFKKRNIRHVIPHSQLHCALLERFIRTIKTRIERYFHSKGTRRWVDVLEKITLAINRSYSRGIGMSPIEAIKSKIISTPCFGEERKCKLAVGDLVRISSFRSAFQKGYAQNATDEMFIISKCVPGDPPYYNIKALDGEEIKGIFYSEELIPCANPGNVYLVEKILDKRKYRGQSQVLIKWKGYAEPSWEDEKNVFKL